jgi:hypothetical protein
MSEPEKYVEVHIPVPWSDKPIKVISYGFAATSILLMVFMCAILAGFRLAS